jgi:hypothetical protein
MRCPWAIGDVALHHLADERLDDVVGEPRCSETGGMRCTAYRPLCEVGHYAEFLLLKGRFVGLTGRKCSA